MFKYLSIASLFFFSILITASEKTPNFPNQPKRLTPERPTKNQSKKNSDKDPLIRSGCFIIKNTGKFNEQQQ